MKDEIKKQLDKEEWEEQEYFFELEESWRRSLPRLSDFEWLEVFPDAKKILPDKLKEWEAEKQRLIGIVKKHLRESTPGNYWEMRVSLQVSIIPRIEAAAKHIARLQRQIRHISGRPITGRITEADIQRAKEIPIASLLSTNLRKTGKTITTTCPLHADRSPSFVIYTETNSCWCFGCQQGGDIIALTQKLHGLTFIDAVKYLLRV